MKTEDSRNTFTYALDVLLSICSSFIAQTQVSLQLQSMGAEESKGGNYGLMGATSVESNMNKQATAARPWSLLHMCSLEQWKNGHAGLWLCRVVAPFSFYLQVLNYIVLALCQTCIYSKTNIVPEYEIN